MRFQPAHILAALLVLAAIAVAPLGAVASAQVPPAWGSATDDFYLELRLDHVRQKLHVEVGQAPAYSPVYIEVRTSRKLPDGTVTQSLDYHIMQTGMDGRALVNVHVHPEIYDVNRRIKAYTIDKFGIVDETQAWQVKGRRAHGYKDIESFFPGLYGELLAENELSLFELNPTSMINRRFEWKGFSFTFAPDTAPDSLEIDLSGPGMVYGIAPMSSMRMSSGPAGVFTAN